MFNAAVTFILVLRCIMSGPDAVSYWKKQGVFYGNKTMFMRFPVWLNGNVMSHISSHLLTIPSGILSATGP